jgi:hemolysin activation/secretion protein
MKYSFVTLVAASLIANPVFAETPEINKAKIKLGAPKASLTPSDVIDLGQDPTPFGVSLQKVRVENSRTDNAISNPALQARIAPLIGQDLSFKLLSDIQAAVTKYYRSIGRPLVSVTVPPQEISDGAIKVDVTTFILSKKQVEGQTKTSEEYLKNQVRLAQGDEINANRLVEDINWLNLNPFRRVQGVFEPGKEFGTTNVIIEVKEDRPWSAFVGISNSGNASTGETRLFAGFNTAALPWPDHQLAYQFTTSADTLKEGRLFNSGTDEAGYVSHAATYFAPLTFGTTRAKFTLQGYFASSYSTPSNVIATQSDTAGISAELAFPLSKVGDKYSLFPEIYGKLDYKKKDEDQFFGGAAVGTSDTKVRQISVGIRANTFGELLGKSSTGGVDLSLVSSNTSINSSSSTSTTFLKFSAQQTLGLSDDISVSVNISGQASNRSLSPLDQFGIGGVGTVRGYNSSEASSNSGIAASIEFAGKPIPLGGDGIFPISISPFGFVDAGYVRPTTTTASETLSSVGLGGRFTLGKSATATLEAAHSLTDGPSTRSGKTTVHFNIAAQF